MNKIKSFKSHALVRHCLLVMVGMLCALPSWAREVVVNGVKYEVNEQEQEAVVVGLNDKKSSTVEIQKYVSGYLVSRIESNAFSYCSSLTSISISSSVTSIGRSAFSYCSSLFSISIPSSVTSIGDNAFSYCSSLVSISIPSSVTSIGDNAFSGCSSLTAITVDESNPIYSSENNVLFSKKDKSLIRAGFGLVKYDIPSWVTSIGGSAFSHSSSLTSINIPSSVTSVGEYAFYGCSDLKTVRFKGKMPPSTDVYALLGTSDLKVYVPHGTLEAYKAVFYVNNAEIVEENQSTLYPQALELFTPDYTSLIPSKANAKQVAAVQNKADYTANDGLIVDASQLSSNAVEPTEGSLAALIDNDRSTFFHTTWTETNTTGDWHYLQVDLCASYKQIVLKYTKRQGYNSGTPVKLHVYATNTPDAAGGWEDLGTQTCTYGYESGQTGILPLSLGNGYRHVRLTVEETADNKKSNGNLFFYWSELHAYHRPCKADALDEAKRSALTTAMAQAKKEMDAGQETSETTDALQDALTDAENFISLNEWKAVDFAKSFYLTAYSDKPMAVPTGMQAAIVLADNNGDIRTDYCYNAGDVIPAHTGVLLKSGKGNAFHLPIAATAEDAPEGNLLHGTLTDEITYAEGCDRYYKLSYDFETRSVIGFYWAEDNAAPFLNKAGKAFLALPSDAKVAICGVSLNELAEGATTAIRPITDAPTAPFRAYTLDGRRVNAASQGELKKGFYIINGRKVMVK